MGRSLQLCPCGNTDSPMCPLPLLCSIARGQQKWSALGSGSETFLESHEVELFLTWVGCSAEGFRSNQKCRGLGGCVRPSNGPQAWVGDAPYTPITGHPHRSVFHSERSLFSYPMLWSYFKPLLAPDPIVMGSSCLLKS